MSDLTTKRIILRAIVKSDAPAFAQLCNDEELARNTARIPHPYTLDHAKGFVAYAEEARASRTEFTFAVCEHGDIVACCGVRAMDGGTHELGYWVGRDARGRGVATEAARAVVAFAFDTLGAREITAGHFADNPASGRVLEKIGFVKTGETPDLFSLGRGGESKTVRMALRRG